MKESGLRLKKKLQSKAGETIAETLVTMIILSLVVLMLAGEATTARVNKQADNRYLFPDKRQTGAKVSTGTNSTSDPFRRECCQRCLRIKCGNSGAGISNLRQTVWKRVYIYYKIN